MSSRILVIGKIDEALKKSISTLIEMKKGKDEILFAILPWMKMQKEIIETNPEYMYQIQINLILTEEDVLQYIDLIKD